MAQLYPDFYTIQHLHQPATEGELALLDFLQKNLSPEFEIYFQPFINGDRPDIVILKKNGGAIIILMNTQIGIFIKMIVQSFLLYHKSKNIETIL